MMTFWTGFIAGVVVGIIAGTLTIALCYAAKDDEMEVKK